MLLNSIKIRNKTAHKAFKRTKTVGFFTPLNILANNFLPLNVALYVHGGLVINIYLFDWGDTLMVDFPDVIGKMCDWEIVKAVSGAKEALDVLSKHSQIYIATGAADSTELEIKRIY